MRGPGMSDDKYLTTAEASACLAEMGLPLAPTTLRKMRCVGGGPPFHHYGRTPVYTAPRLREYALSRLSAERSSTSSDVQATAQTPPALRRARNAAKRPPTRAGRRRA